jgi:hypothetical protein
MAIVFVVVLVGPGSAAEPIGRVKVAAGAASLIRGGQSAALHVGDPIWLNDTVVTAADGSVGLTFTDQSRLAIGPNTRIAIDQYAYAPAEKQLSFVTRVSQGTLYYVSGMIAKLSKEKVAVATPEGTIGIRGTRFLVKVD